MSLSSKRIVQPAQESSSTFFAAAEQKPAEQKPATEAPKAVEQKPATEQAKKPAKPASTFLDTGRGHVDPIHSLSTHRSRTSWMTDDERAARKAEQEQRARRGLENLQAAMNRQG